MARVLCSRRLIPTLFKLTVSYPLITMGRPVFLPRQIRWNVKANICCGVAGNGNKQTPQNHDAQDKKATLGSGLYLVATPIGNLEDITLRALRVLKSADLILCEDTRHSGKLLQHYSINTPLMSYHKFNESLREATIVQRLQQGHIIALISDAGTPGISDPGAEIVKVCIEKKIRIFPIPGPCSIITALTASGLSTSEFSFVGFLPTHNSTRKAKLMAAAKELATQVFFVPPHKLNYILEESISTFGEARQCVIARELTKLHEEFWKGTLAEAKGEFAQRNPKGEITLLIQGSEDQSVESPEETELESQLQDLFSNGHRLSEAVKLVSERIQDKKQGSSK
ncbi:hypothetical protein SUGI_0019170 [Cryptomeria japonica]|nr:hypothetical protein SUGI_0019170 [Cryptomeria japonica]